MSAPPRPERGVHAAEASRANEPLGLPDASIPLGRFCGLNRLCENAVAFGRLRPSNGVAPESSPRREPWVAWRTEASRSAAAEGRRELACQQGFLPPLRGSQRSSAEPTAHAVGYFLAQLRCWNPDFRDELGVFTQAVKAALRRVKGVPAAPSPFLILNS